MSGPSRTGGHDPEQTRGEITQLLKAHARGQSDAFDSLLPLVYADLKRVAHGQLWSRDSTLQTTDLVHEAWLKLSGGRVDWESRGHFFAIAARAMRQVVIDHARSRLTAKRGGDRMKVPFEEASHAIEEQCSAVLALEEALGHLDSLEPRLAQVVDCRFFAGLTLEETSQALSVSTKTVQRDWLRARALLRELLGADASALNADEGAATSDVVD